VLLCFPTLMLFSLHLVIFKVVINDGHGNKDVV
jgi:hypothetical protein